MDINGEAMRCEPVSGRPIGGHGKGASRREP